MSHSVPLKDGWARRPQEWRDRIAFGGLVFIATLWIATAKADGTAHREEMTTIHL